MPLHIRNPEADKHARRLARIDGTTITDAVIAALRETIRERLKRETPSETAKRLLDEHGLSLKPGRRPVPRSVYHDMDHDLTGQD